MLIAVCDDIKQISPKKILDFGQRWCVVSGMGVVTDLGVYGYVPLPVARAAYVYSERAF